MISTARPVRAPVGRDDLIKEKHRVVSRVDPEDFLVETGNRPAVLQIVGSRRPDLECDPPAFHRMIIAGPLFRQTVPAFVQAKAAPPQLRIRAAEAQGEYGAGSRLFRAAGFPECAGSAAFRIPYSAEYQR